MIEPVIKPIVQSWLVTIKKACEHKQQEFGDSANEIMRFFEGPHDFMYTMKYASERGGYNTMRVDDAFPDPAYKHTFNKPAEVLQLFGPSLYHRNPHRKVAPAELPPIDPSVFGNPQDPNVAMMAQVLQQNRQVRATRSSLVSGLLQHYLNYTPNELDLRRHSRQAIDEAILKGMGTLWPGLHIPRGTQTRMIGSFYETVDNLVFDPDMEDRKQARFAARRRVLPKREVEELFGLKRGTLQGNSDSRTNQAHLETDNYYKARGDSHDLFTYWEVYSRMGIGNRLKDFGERRVDQIVRPHLDDMGSFCFLAVSEDYGWPLNLPESVCNSGSKDEIFQRLQWPTPFWADPTDPWPFVCIAFHDRPRKVWPMSHIKPALGEIRFLNWAFTFLADKMKNTSRDFVACLKSASEDIKAAITSGRDLTLLEFEGSNNKNINEIVQFLQHPEMNRDMWTVIESMMQLLERRLGVNELMYGESSRQMRSAQEAQSKYQSTRIRPDDMAEIVEDSMTLLARKEAFAAYWNLKGQDMLPVMGQDGAMLWDRTVAMADPREILQELSYRIEAGSIRKPNKDRDQANANQILQVVGPMAQLVYQMTGNPKLYNALLDELAKANDWPQGKFVVEPPPPQPNPEQMKLQLEQQKMQMDMQMKQLDAQIKQQESQAELQIKAQEAQQEMVLDQQQHEQELQQDREMHMLDIMQKREEGAIKMQLAQAQSAQKIQQTQMEGALAQQKSQQEMAIAEKEGEQRIKLSEQQGQAKIKQADAQSKAKIAQQKAQAKAKPKPKKSP